MGQQIPVDPSLAQFPFWQSWLFVHEPPFAVLAMQLPLPSQARFEPHEVPTDAFDALQTGIPVVQLYVPGAQVVPQEAPGVQSEPPVPPVPAPAVPPVPVPPEPLAPPPPPALPPVPAKPPVPLVPAVPPAPPPVPPVPPPAALPPVPTLPPPPPVPPVPVGANPAAPPCPPVPLPPASVPPSRTIVAEPQPVEQTVATARLTNNFRV